MREIQRNGERDLHAHRRLLRYLADRRHAVQVGIDVTSWCVGLLTAFFVRFEFTWSPIHEWHLGQVALIGALAQIVAGAVFGLYVGRWKFGSFEEVAALVRTVVAVGLTLALFSVLLTDRRLVPLSVLLMGAVFTLVFMAAARYVWRMRVDLRMRPDADATRVLVFGAGEGAAQLLRAMLRNPSSSYQPVALLDDDPSKRHLRLMGVPVIGGRHDLARAVHETGAEVLVIAVPSARSSLLRAISAEALALGLPVRVVPAVGELLDGSIDVNDIRPLTEADLLSRSVIETDIDAVAGYLTNKRVLITGAGGSIGSELSRRVHHYAPAQLVLLDRDESALHSLQMSIEGRALLDSRNLVVADIRDRDRMLEVFREHQPEVVFHAAALKHLPLLEMHPGEALKTNVFGTTSVLDAAASVGVERFVNISTDKAADPISVLGYSKRIAERLTAAVANREHGTYLSVRFGNVLGSRGSMLGVFERQVANGGPLTVTHPDVTRFFMTVEEAVQLVLQAGAVGSDGEALVLDMGEPVRIADVARRMVAQSERPINIVYTGLRPGEKLAEVLIGDGEVDVRPRHPLISHVRVPPLNVRQLKGLLDVPLNELAGEMAIAAQLPPTSLRLAREHIQTTLTISEQVHPSR